MTWRPMATAPKDRVIWLWAGERLLGGWRRHWSGEEGEGRWDAQGYVSDRVTLTSRDKLEPTLWQPLPEDPE